MSSHFQRFILFLSLLFIHSYLMADVNLSVNSIGYFPDQEKRATFSVPCDEFHVVRVNDKEIVFRGKANEPFENKDTSETVYIADFSSLTESGEYQLTTPDGGSSAVFTIGDDIYREPFRTVMKGMYLWRCGTAVSGTHNGNTFAHAACHLEDAYLDYVGQEGVKHEATGGWHDAGDYNKYIVNAGVTVGCMYLAWEHFSALRDIQLDLPGDEANNRLPDFLDEMKWEMDWVLKMQAPDGSVYHKLSTTNFGGFIMPEAEKEKRFITPYSTAATADFVAMTAMTARIFKDYDSEYAMQCLDAAEKSFAFLKANPDNQRANLEGFRTGAYQTRDNDDRLWAAAELWQTTGNPEYLNDFETMAKAEENLIDVNWDWGNVKNLGMFTYLLSKRDGRNAELVSSLQKALMENADSIVQTSREHGYERPLGDRYYWGCNGTVARQCLNLSVAYQLSPKPEYQTISLAALGHLFGRNYYNRSFVTGLGHLPPMNPHSRRSGGDNIVDPWTGYLVGGGHNGTGWVDEEESYQTNEIAINWNGALVYALAAFVSQDEKEQSAVELFMPK